MDFPTYPHHRAMAPCPRRGCMGRREPLLPHRPHSHAKASSRRTPRSLRRPRRRVSHRCRHQHNRPRRHRRHPCLRPPHRGRAAIRRHPRRQGRPHRLDVRLVRDRRRHARILTDYEQRPASPTTLWGKMLAAVSGYNTLVILGVAVFFLSDLLGVLFEIELRTE